MVVRITFALLAVCLLQIVTSAPEQTGKLSLLEELQKSATNFIDSLNSNVNSFFKSKDQEEIKKLYHENTDSIVSKVTEISNNIKEQFKGVDDQVKASLQKTASDLDAAVNNLKGKNSEVGQKADEVGGFFKQGFENLLQETQKAAEVFEKDTKGLDQTVTGNLKKLFNDVASELHATSTRLQEASSKQ